MVTVDGEVLLWQRGELQRWRHGAPPAGLGTVADARGHDAQSPDEHIVRSPDGRWAAIGLRACPAVLIELATWADVALDGSTGAGVCFLPDGRLVTGAAGGGLLAWQHGDRAPAVLVAAGAERFGEEAPFALACAADGASVAVAVRGRVDLVDAATGAVRHLGRTDSDAFSLAFTAGDSALVGLDGYGGVTVRDVVAGYARTLAGPGWQRRGLRVDDGAVLIDTAGPSLAIVDCRAMATGCSGSCARRPASRPAHPDHRDQWRSSSRLWKFAVSAGVDMLPVAPLVNGMRSAAPVMLPSVSSIATR